jgi:signal transduction histidine kinase/CheY-like chemotaxis protein
MPQTSSLPCQSINCDYTCKRELDFFSRSTAMSQEKILILEDHPELRDEICSLAAEAGYVVESVASGAEALGAASRKHYDLLIADVYLPDISGIETFRQMQAHDPGLAAIAVTGYSSWEVAMEAVRAGFTGFLAKPFAREELLSAISAALEQEKLRRENVRLRALVPLYELSRTFMGTSELSQVLDQIVTTARDETRAEVVSLMLLEHDGQSLSIAAASGLSAGIIETQKTALGSGIAGWVAAQGKPLMIAEGVPLDPELRQAMGKPEVLSALSLPLTTLGETIGVLNLARLRGGEPFTHGDLELATVLAGQAAIAIEKARLIEDLRSLSETSQLLAAALDLDEAASIIIEASARVANAKGAAFWLVEEVSDQLALYKTWDLQPEELRRLRPPAVFSLAAGEEFAVRDGKGILCVPIIRAGRRFGLIELHLPGPVPPRPDRRGVLRTLAHTAAAVIESHRLRAREVIAFRELGDALRTDSNLQQVLRRVVSQMIEACEAHGGSIYLLGEDGEHLEAFAASGLQSPDEIAYQIMREKRPVLLGDSHVSGAAEVRSIVGVPMGIGNRVEGAVVLTHRSEGAFAPHHLNLLTVLANSTSLVVRNAQLYARSEELAISEERTRIAREIHDGLAQDLAFLVLKVEVMRKLLHKGKRLQVEKEMGETVEALRNDMREVRRTIFALRPLDLESLGFLPALEKFTNEFGNANDVKIRFEHSGDASALSTKLQTALFRLAQESLNNVRKHAGASNVWVDLMLDDEWATLSVRDDGRGFDETRALPDARARGSVGMVQMRERAERAGGSFEIETAPGQGTRVLVKLPVKSGDQSHA